MNLECLETHSLSRPSSGMQKAVGEEDLRIHGEEPFNVKMRLCNLMKEDVTSLAGDKLYGGV